ncbi:phosphatidylinositol-glycan biosynthesis class W protein-like isoform X2 [Lineus longissimus]
MDGSASYKELHEAFVSNLSGTSVADVGLVINTASISVVIRNVVAAFIFYPTTIKTRFSLDFISYVLPTELCVTVLSDHYLFFHTSLICVSAAIVIFLYMTDNDRKQAKTIQRSRKKTRKGHLSSATSDKSVINVYLNKLQEPMEGNRNFITNFRAFAIISTAISILAVDFVIFPRRFAKAETYGSGLMDIGVGGFMISNAIVSPEARGKYNPTRNVREKLERILKSFVSTAPLFILGGLRLLAVKSSEVAEHTSEYGVHWNFFFTLASVKVLSTTILCFVDPRLSCGLATIVTIAHQMLLSYCGGMSYIIYGSDGFGSRSNIIDANREGIVSSLGYSAIYFAGIHIGHLLFSKRSSLQLFVHLVGVSAIFYMLVWCCGAYSELISRRAANLPYILWMIACNVQIIGGLLLAEMATEAFHLFIHKKPGDQKECFSLLEAINENGLLFFLLANILTGTINLLMKTIYAPPAVGLLVVTVYLFVLSVVMFYLKAKNIKTKIW